jgi:hypothetical protein
LDRRIAGNHVPADEIPRGERSEPNPVDVSTAAVLLDDIAAARAEQADPEVVGQQPARGHSRLDRAVAGGLIPSNAVVHSVEVAIAAAGKRAGCDGIADQHVFFDVAVCHRRGLKSAETVMVRGDMLYFDVTAVDYEHAMPTELLDHPRSQDLHVIVAVGGNAVF